MENFTGWHFINLMFIPLNLWIAIWSFKNGRNMAGHINMLAVLLNSLTIAAVIGLI